MAVKELLSDAAVSNRNLSPTLSRDLEAIENADLNFLENGAEVFVDLFAGRLLFETANKDLHGGNKYSFNSLMTGDLGVLDSCTLSSAMVEGEERGIALLSRTLDCM